MAIASWIAQTGLPQVPQKGYTESIGANILNTPMDSGIPKRRYRGQRPDMLSVQFLMDTTQIATLDTFISGTIKYVNRFLFTHPRKGTPVEVRIQPQNDGNMYSLSYVAPYYYTVSMTLEVLP